MCRKETRALCPKTLAPTYLPHLQWVAIFTSTYFNWGCYHDTNCPGISAAGLHVHTKRTELHLHHLCNTNMLSLAFSPQAKVLLSNSSTIYRITVTFEQPPKTVNTTAEQIPTVVGKDMGTTGRMSPPPPSSEKQDTTQQVSSNSGRTHERDRGQQTSLSLP